MISRRSARILAEVFEEQFAHSTGHYYSGSHEWGYKTKVYKSDLYDFLFDHEYPAWFLEQGRNLSNIHRAVQEWIMKLHTGETQAHSTPNWTWEQRRQLGQEYLANLAEDLLEKLETNSDEGDREVRQEAFKKLAGALELDGYIYRDGTLHHPESEVLDAREEQGVLASLFNTLKLNDARTAFHHLALSEEHYLAGRWDDSISNSRKFLEVVVREVSVAVSERGAGSPLAGVSKSRQRDLRDYLVSEGLLEPKEKEALAKIYGLLSETGAHPYMARNDQARLLRHLSLTLSQFIMLRSRGRLGL